NVDPDKAQPGAKTDTADSDLGLQDRPEPEVKGLGIAPGARRPGAKKATAPSTEPAAAQPDPEPASEPAAEQPEPSGDGNGEGPATPVKGLGIAKGARPPGKR
ncbi:MAG: FeS-binding protein, partial [Mycobacteriaceae bacterium]